MGRLEKLRSRFFCTNDKRIRSKQTKPSLPISDREESIDTADLKLKPISTCDDQSSTDASTKHRTGGRLYWNEARRIYSDPIPLSHSDRDTGSCESKPCKAPVCGEFGGDWEVNGVEEELEDDDDVFLDSWEDLSVDDNLRSSPLDSYGDFATLRQTNDWTWPTTQVDCSAWNDWRITPHELELGEVISCTNRETIYKGYWHGGVHVHTREAKDVEDVVCFLKEVQTLSCIRHENIQLFMGACVNENFKDTLSLVMSEVVGASLHVRLHNYSHSFTNPSKLKILQQIAEGMEYLHAKKISHGLLSSAHISLTCRVCISLAPLHSNPQTFYSSELTYLPPEYIREVCVGYDRSATYHDVGNGQRVQGLVSRTRSFRTSQIARRGRRRVSTISLRSHCSSSFAADIFAFGTITYELMTLEHPFKHLPMECVVLRVGQGQCQSLDKLTNNNFKAIISKCWKTDPLQRPTFRDLVTSLELNASDPRVSSPGLKSSVSLPLLSGYS